MEVNFARIKIVWKEQLCKLKFEDLRETGPREQKNRTNMENLHIGLKENFYIVVAGKSESLRWSTTSQKTTPEGILPQTHI